MAFENIQLGLDLATSVSVIGAALAFIINNRKSELDKKNESMRKLRIEQTTKAVDGFLNHINRGIDLQVLADKVTYKHRNYSADEQIKNQEAINKESQQIIDDVYYFVRKANLHLRFNTKVLLESVLEDEGLKIIENLIDYLRDSAPKIDAGEVNISQINKTISEALIALMNLVKK